MIRKKAHADLDQWLERACASLVTSFANGIIKDKTAINAAIATSWSNGQTEGQITKLKLDVRARQARPAASSPNRQPNDQGCTKVAIEPKLHAETPSIN